MKRLTYSKRTSLVLHVEDYTNAGLKQDDMMTAIKEIDGVWMIKPYPINSNIEVHIKGHSDAYIGDIFIEIHYVLEKLLNDTVKPRVKSYFDDLQKWEESFCCNECGNDDKSEFSYDRTVANGQVWHCKQCKTELLVGHKPNEDNY